MFPNRCLLSAGFLKSMVNSARGRNSDTPGAKRARLPLPTPPEIPLHTRSPSPWRAHAALTQCRLGLALQASLRPSSQSPAPAMMRSQSCPIRFRGGITQRQTQSQVSGHSTPRRGRSGGPPVPCSLPPDALLRRCRRECYSLNNTPLPRRSHQQSPSTQARRRSRSSGPAAPVQPLADTNIIRCARELFALNPSAANVALTRGEGDQAGVSAAARSRSAVRQARSPCVSPLCGHRHEFLPGDHDALRDVAHAECCVAGPSCASERAASPVAARREQHQALPSQARAPPTRPRSTTVPAARSPRGHAHTALSPILEGPENSQSWQRTSAPTSHAESLRAALSVQQPPSATAPAPSSQETQPVPSPLRAHGHSTRSRSQAPQHLATTSALPPVNPPPVHQRGRARARAPSRANRQPPRTASARAAQQHSQLASSYVPLVTQVPLPHAYDSSQYSTQPEQGSSRRRTTHRQPAAASQPRANTRGAARAQREQEITDEVDELLRLEEDSPHAHQRAGNASQVPLSPGEPNGIDLNAPADAYDPDHAPGGRLWQEPALPHPHTNYRWDHFCNGQS